MSIELPEHLRTGPLAEAAAKALADAANMASASNSVPRISLRGREFRIIKDGEEVAKFRDELDVIILGVEPEANRMIKTFYKGGYTSGSKEPPTCSSDDGIAPAPWVQEKQSPNCQSCPKNQFGSAKSASGKASKACRDSKRAWVVLNDDSGPLADRTMYGLGVTVASLKSFSEHGRQLAAMGQGPAVCVTQLKMIDTEFPQLEFHLKAWLDADKAPQSLKLAAARPWKINFANAGLALAMGDSPSTTRSALPMAVPDHLRQADAAISDVQDAVVSPSSDPRPTPTAKDFDDAVGNW